MQIIELDLSNKLTREEDYPTIHAKQGDVGRKFKVVLTDCGQNYLIPEGAVFSVWYFGTSGEGNYSAIGDRSAFLVEGNSVIVEIITQMLQNSGGGSLCLLIHGTDGEQIGLWNIPYKVEAVKGIQSKGASVYYSALSEYAALTAQSASKAEKCLAKVEELVSRFDILSVYPIGSVYISLATESPASIFGGTWEQIRGKFLIAASEEEGYGLGTSGGEFAHTLTDDEMPRTPIFTETGTVNYNMVGDLNVGSIVGGFAPSGGWIGGPNVMSSSKMRVAGGGQAHNNIPPYLSVNMWKRVA